jgi:hypothetical protein
VRLEQFWGKLKGVTILPEWRNWQTHGTQNPASFTGYEGSTPSSGTSYVLRRRMSNFGRGVFTLVAGYAFLLGLTVILLGACGMFGGECDL